MTNPAPALLSEIRDIYLGNAQRPYGLYGINQLQHALQSAAHAEAQALSSSLVIACLLHDVGHMIHDLGEAPAEEASTICTKPWGPNGRRRAFPWP